MDVPRTGYSVLGSLEPESKDYGTTEVADTAIAMMPTFARGTAALDAAVRADLKGGWTHVHNVATLLLS